MECERKEPEKRMGTFRVWTATDFGTGRQVPDKRRAGQLTTACRMCRLRKVKCLVTHREHGSESVRSPQCQPCRNSNLDCKWDVIDGRKRKRRKPFDPDQSASGAGEQQNPESSREVLDHPNGCEAGQNDSQTNTKKQESSKESSSVELGGTEGANEARQNDGELAQGTGTQLIPSVRLNPGSYHEPQMPFEELCAEAGVEIPPNWPDLQDFIFEADVFGHVDHGGQEYLPPPIGPSPGRSKSDFHAPSRPRIVKLRYYRRLGPTAVVPGFRRLSMAVNPDQEETYEGEHSGLELDDYTSGWGTASPSSAASDHNRLFDKSTCQPNSDIMPMILHVFFEHFEGHFPFLNPEILGGHVQAGEASSFLLNAIAALTVRFCPLEGPLAYLQDRYSTNWGRGAPFLKKAKEQLVSLLSLPEPEVVAGLIILSWAEFGDNNETGLWMLTGMAIRMAQDLGFHRTPETNTDPNASFHDNARPSASGNYSLTDEQSAIHQQKARLVMFWSVFILDVCVSLVTGRPPTIRRSEVETPLPTAQDMKLAQLDFDEKTSIKNLIFPATVSFMLHFSEALDLLNQPSSRVVGDVDATLCRIRQDLVQSYNSLPPELVFTIANYRSSLKSNQSGLYLTLHMFFYTFMMLLTNSRLHHERVGRPSMGSANILDNRPLAGDGSDESENRAEITTIACQKMAQILTISDLVDQKGYLATPFTNHCCFIAASTILNDSDFRHQKQRPSQETFLGSVANVDYEFFHEKLQQQSKYFGAISSVIAVLDCRRQATVDNVEPRAPEGLDTETEVGRVVALGDPGIVNRYTIRQQEE
ncbi:fungal-specific transcription factor domain-containing protein [Trichoderma sp. SZMC 28013]